MLRSKSVQISFLKPPVKHKGDSWVKVLCLNTELWHVIIFRFHYNRNQLLTCLVTNLVIIRQIFRLQHNHFNSHFSRSPRLTGVPQRSDSPRTSISRDYWNGMNFISRMPLQDPQPPVSENHSTVLYFQPFNV